MLLEVAVRNGGMHGELRTAHAAVLSALDERTYRTVAALKISKTKTTTLSVSTRPQGAPHHGDRRAPQINQAQAGLLLYSVSATHQQAAEALGATWLYSWTQTAAAA